MLFFQGSPIQVCLILYQQRIEKESAPQFKKRKVDVDGETERVTDGGGPGEGGSSVAEQGMRSSKVIEEEEREEPEGEEQEEEGEESAEVSLGRQHLLEYVCVLICVLHKKDSLLAAATAVQCITRR